MKTVEGLPALRDKWGRASISCNNNCATQPHHFTAGVFQLFTSSGNEQPSQVASE